MQLTERIKNCNGCEACVVACKYNCVKMETVDGLKRPVVNEDGCSKCNACMLYCPLYMPVTMPNFEEFFESDEDTRGREMAPLYRATSRTLRAGQHAEFVGTLCQIAAMKSIRGDKNDRNLVFYPIYCDEAQRASNPACAACTFYK